MHARARARLRPAPRALTPRYVHARWPAAQIRSSTTGGSWRLQLPTRLRELGSAQGERPSPPITSRCGRRLCGGALALLDAWSATCGPCCGPCTSPAASDWLPAAPRPSAADYHCRRQRSCQQRSRRHCSSWLPRPMRPNSAFRGRADAACCAAGAGVQPCLRWLERALFAVRARQVRSQDQVTAEISMAPMHTERQRGEHT